MMGGATCHVVSHFHSSNQVKEVSPNGGIGTGIKSLVNFDLKLIVAHWATFTVPSLRNATGFEVACEIDEWQVKENTCFINSAIDSIALGVILSMILLCINTYSILKYHHCSMQQNWVQDHLLITRLCKQKEFWMDAEHINMLQL